MREDEAGFQSPELRIAPDFALRRSAPRLACSMAVERLQFERSIIRDQSTVTNRSRRFLLPGAAVPLRNRLIGTCLLEIAFRVGWFTEGQFEPANIGNDEDTELAGCGNVAKYAACRRSGTVDLECMKRDSVSACVGLSLYPALGLLA